MTNILVLLGIIFLSSLLSTIIVLLSYYFQRLIIKSMNDYDFTENIKNKNKFPENRLFRMKDIINKELESRK